MRRREALLLRKMDLAPVTVEDAQINTRVLTDGPADDLAGRKINVECDEAAGAVCRVYVCD